MPPFLCALRASDASEWVRLGFELTILCATRTSETLLTTWNETDLSDPDLGISSVRMKSGIDHRIPLAPRCVEILTRAETLVNGSQYVVPGRSGTKPLSGMVLLMVLRRMGRNDVATGHGFRSSFRDWASERTNFPRAVSEAALAHALKDKTEAAYHRTDLFERRRELMTAWAGFATSDSAAKA